MKNIKKKRKRALNSEVAKELIITLGQAEEGLRRE
jgi:hypothetical protein